MHRLMKCCARGALGLGAAALLLAGVPAQAGSSAGAPAIEPRLMAQSTAQPEEAEKLEQSRLKEQQEREKRQLEEKSEMQQPRKMRSMEKQAPAPQAAPPKSGTSRFGAGVIRNKETVDGD